MTGAAKQVIKPRGDAARKNENVERMGFGKLTLINFLACKLALEGEGGWVMSCTQQMHALTDCWLAGRD